MDKEDLGLERNGEISKMIISKSTKRHLKYLYYKGVRLGYRGLRK